MILNKFVKESKNYIYEARVVESADKTFCVEYYINGTLTKTQSFPEKTRLFVENSAKQWAEGVQILNG